MRVIRLQEPPTRGGSNSGGMESKSCKPMLQNYFSDAVFEEYFSETAFHQGTSLSRCLVKRIQ